MGAVHSGRVVVFGAGGPVGASAARALREHYTLLLTDARPLPEIAAAGERQSPGAPLPEVLPAPHETRVVDVTRYEEVLKAARGADALINCTVVRRELEPAFGVNLVGAYHVAKAAVELGIRRLIHTGPYHTGLDHNADTWWEHDVSPDAPLHPGSDLYAMSKFLGGEVTRIFAEEHGLEVVTFLYCAFRPGEGDEAPDGSGVHPFTTRWDDCGEAFLYGLRAPELPRPYEPFFICSDLPHGKYRTDKAKQLLGFEARHRFERLWTRAESEG
ncbi:MAG: NAD-dependent epimerase/dehydratase family protein [Armatimonadota bacterium]